MRNRLQQARSLRQLWLRNAQELPDEAFTGLGATCFDLWAPDNHYAAGQVLAYEGQLYRVVTAHASQPDWTPAAVPALFKALHVTPEAPLVVPEWVQPTGAHDAYRVGDRVRYQDHVWVSQVSGNIYAPGVVSGQWAQA